MGAFREDLYFRLNVMPILIPPLRERREDIPDLAFYLLSGIGRKMNKRLEGLSAEVMEALVRYDWPGNVRELANILERAGLLCAADIISQEDLPSDLSRSFPPSTETKPGHLSEAISRTRRQHLLSALDKTGWKKKEAAALLGLSPRAFSYYLSKYDLERERGTRNEED